MVIAVLLYIHFALKQAYSDLVNIIKEEKNEYDKYEGSVGEGGY